MPEPHRIGILNDMSAGPPGPGNIERWLRVALAEVQALGRLDREVEFVHAWGLGLPEGSAAAVERAYAELAAADVLGVIGPAIGDNALVATPLAEHYRLPTINWAGTERARGEYMFHLQVGSHEDESWLLARHIAAQGLGSVGVVHDSSPIGRRYLAFFQQAAEALPFEVVETTSIQPLADSAQQQVARLAARSPDAVVYLGLGVAAPALAQALRASAWRGATLMNSAGIRGYAGDCAQLLEGWIYVDLFSEGNRTLTALRERENVPAGESLAAAKGYDLGQLLAWGLAWAPEFTREGLREGLERVKWLPAAQGLEGTLLGFGQQDRGALHGHYLVLRRWRDGRTEQVSR